ncbi:MAG: hypothetical protein OXQ89_01590 [Rhodospirillaceae bacterium]|nr:hypothetical protein [Rhodospirillaceae bacterium]
MANKENSSERAVRASLEQDYGMDAIRRPDQDPPDYLVADRYAVEVTELHPQLAGESDKSTTEPIAATIRGVFAGKRPPESLGRLQVYFEYSAEHVPAKKRLQSELRDAIRPYVESENSVPGRKDSARHLPDAAPPLHVCLPCGVSLEFWPCSGTPEFAFDLHGGTDTGVLVVSELLTSATRQIAKKTQRIERVLRAGSRYRSCDWWLVLVDHIGLPPNSENYSDLDELRRDIHVPTLWNRIILFDYLTGSPHELSPG